MIISDQKTIQDIKKDFHQIFPSLKLEFYTQSHQEGQGSSAKTQIENDALLGDIRTIHQQADWQIKPEMSVNEFEQAFLNTFGLNVQVFRKSGNLWMQTTSTDHWTLGEQNRKGGSSVLHFHEKYDA
jgi:hypothetical protein